MHGIKEVQELLEFLNGYTDLPAKDILDSIPELGYRVKEAQRAIAQAGDIVADVCINRRQIEQMLLDRGFTASRSNVGMVLQNADLATNWANETEAAAFQDIADEIWGLEESLELAPSDYIVGRCCQCGCPIIREPKHCTGCGSVSASEE